MLSQEKKKFLSASLQNSEFSSLVTFIFFLNLYFTVMRLHDFPGFNLLGKARMPAVLTTLCCVFFIPYLFRYTSYWVVKISVWFVVIEAIRGFLGFTIFQDFVINDALQFFTWRDIVFYLLSTMVPVVYLMGTTQGIRKFINFFVINSFFLGLWAITHSGFGPGGYIGDENDNCLYLLTLIPISIFAFVNGKGPLVKLFSFMSTFLLIGGVVVTNSRGGFLGFVAIFTFLFFVSKRKITWIISCVIGLAVLIPFVPEKYISEVKSIQSDSTAKKGTIRERLDTWGIIFKMWTDPKNTIQGVGLSNSKFNLGDYQYVDETVRSLSGRQAHSLYFQVLGDLGLWGIFVYGSMILSSIGCLVKIKKESRYYLERVGVLLYSITKPNEVREPPSKNSNDISDLEFYSFLNSEIQYVESLARMLFCSWTGLLVSGLGISVCYYPTIWLFPALSLGLYIYFYKLTEPLREM